mmetsp:Transcript_46555/g.94869  ORF Transcript_46555/g.94869 Transcript_46555/m.94869 type:complete len:299 (+) Transcript_46555:627-1523(+)
MNTLKELSQRTCNEEEHWVQREPRPHHHQTSILGQPSQRDRQAVLDGPQATSHPMPPGEAHHTVACHSGGRHWRQLGILLYNGVLLFLLPCSLLGLGLGCLLFLPFFQLFFVVIIVRVQQAGILVDVEENIDEGQGEGGWTGHQPPRLPEQFVNLELILCFCRIQLNKLKQVLVPWRWLHRPHADAGPSQLSEEVRQHRRHWRSAHVEKGTALLPLLGTLQQRSPAGFVLGEEVAVHRGIVLVDVEQRNLLKALPVLRVHTPGSLKNGFHHHFHPRTLLDHGIIGVLHHGGRIKGRVG